MQAPPDIGPYRVDSFLCEGSLGTSMIWRGVDRDTGDPVVFKTYTVTESGEVWKPSLFANEIEVQHALAHCGQLAPMLATDNRRTIIKPYVAGDFRNPPPLDRGAARSVLADALTFIVSALRAGRVVDHALRRPNWTAIGGRFVAIESCCSPRADWEPHAERMIAHLQQTLWVLLRPERIPPETLHDLGPNPTTEDDRRVYLDRMHDWRRAHMLATDPELVEAMEANTAHPAAMLAAVEALC